ncbi:MAG: BlaI/MecI/CopY family transcriptional regulator [Tepidisphaeraceae bacterium]|jgi:BlaI family penicillinase repressor
MSKLPAISDAEWEVMNVLWACSPLTAGEVVEGLKDKKEWSPRTVKTLLNRLVKKGALVFSTQGNRYLYRPAVTRESCVRTESRSFLSRVFGDEVGPMLTQFVRQADLSPKEIEELTRALKEKTTPAGKPPSKEK